jgi:hypothetical protein
MHHILSDGWSMAVLAREFRSLYMAYTAGRPSPLAPLKLQYADFAAWQRNTLSYEVMSGKERFWRDYLDSAAAISLPYDDAGGANMPTGPGGSSSIQIDARQTETLRRLSQLEHCTLSTVLLTAFKLVIRRYTGQNDISIGVPVAVRPSVETEGLVGYFVNHIAIRTRLDAQQPFVEALRLVRMSSMNALIHYDFPLTEMAGADLHQLLYRVRYNYLGIVDDLTTEAGEKTPMGVSMENVVLDKPQTPFGLSMYVGVRNQTLAVNLRYRSDLFKASTIERMLSEFRSVLLSSEQGL